MMEDRESFHKRMVDKYGLVHLPVNWVYKKARSSMKRPVAGVGINDVEFSCQPTVSGKQLGHPAYQLWYAMLGRCYANSVINNASYAGVTCCSEWLTFSNFLFWYNSNYYSGYVLDKDLLVRGNKTYSPLTCIFIPSQLNGFLLTCSASRGILPLGTHKNHNKFRSQISLDGGKTYLGDFDTPEEAHKAWQLAKIEQAKDLMVRLSISQLQLVIDRLSNDYNNNLITEIL